jgi:hypothetical protein
MGNLPYKAAFPCLWPPFFVLGVKVKARQAVFQAPRPEVKVYSPDGALKMEFDTSRKKGLQAYSFSTSVNDVRGRFSLTFHPDENDYRDPVFDNIEELDIVKIYESRNHFKQRRADGMWQREIFPAFTGVVRKKRYAAQAGDNGAARKFVVSGHSVAGLIADFHLNTDVNAQIITGDMANGDNIAHELTVWLQEDKPRQVKEIVKIIWDYFIKISNQYRKTVTVKIQEILKTWMGEDFFDIDGEMEFHYPLANVFNRKSDNSFFDIINNILPGPVYEKYAYTDRATGIMKIKIRECPFDPDPWDALKYADSRKKGRLLDCYSIPARLVKSFDIEQSDEEVYTVFFSYLNGYPGHETKWVKLAAAMTREKEKQMPGLEFNDEKFSIYGYRPLMAHFIGYGKSAGDAATEERLRGLNRRLEDWYGNLEKMYTGSVTLGTDLSMDMPQAGEKCAFLGGEFYVEGAERTWNYEGNPQTALSVSRGGVYINGEFNELKYWGRRRSMNGLKGEEETGWIALM